MLTMLCFRTFFLCIFFFFKGFDDALLLHFFFFLFQVDDALLSHLSLPHRDFGRVPSGSQHRDAAAKDCALRLG